MEKQRKIRSNKFFAGLLNLFALAIFFAAADNGFAQAQKRLTYSIIKELVVVPVNQINFSANDCAFELKIPYVKSDLVQAQIPELPNGVTFVSLRRSEYSDESKTSGTKIELWLNFAEAKTYRIRSLRVYINSKLYYIPFDPVVITENPRNILPRLILTFENGEELISERRGKTADVAKFTAVAGKPVKFRISLQYAVQIISYNWSVPKNALLRELEQFDIAKGTMRSSEFNDEKIPVASFEWEPLYSGNLSLPEVKIIATSYNGTRIELSLPSTLIKVAEGTVITKDAGKEGESYFGYAFTKRAVQEKTSQKNLVSENDCKRIAELRAQERYSVPFTKSYYERKNFESEKGISGSSIEPTSFVCWFSFAVMLLFIILDIIFAVTKKLSGIIVSSGFVVVALVCVVISVTQFSRCYAVFKGGTISPVPEESVSTIASIESGKRVLVEQQAGEWVFVRYGSSGGWVKNKNIIFINK